MEAEGDRESERRGEMKLHKKKEAGKGEDLCKMDRKNARWRQRGQTR